MSSSDDDQSAAAHSKKRRIQRACDVCRRKKIRCDGAQMPAGNRCSNCITYGFECSYVEPAKKRGPPKGYVESIEIRVEKLERLLQTLLPEADLARELAGSSITRLQNQPIVDDDERAQLSLLENLQRLSLNSDTRFFGRSSGAMLLQTALNVKLDAEPQDASRHTEFWANKPSPEPIQPPQYNFPPPDLAASLVDLYFTHVNLLLPVLHRPTFTCDLAAGLHLTNDGFAATFLLVCAIGARFSSDPRVLLDGSDSLHSCGWRWFEQLQLMRDIFGPPPCLYDLQFSALSVIFLHGTSAPQASWTLVSIGIRMGQDVGAHRRKESTHQWTMEDELWKRAFWVLVFLDRMLSAHYGRPCAIQDEDFDLDFPIDCDDEYWEPPDPAQAFHQPKGKPSRISAFIAYLRLCQVLSFTLRTIYSINKSKVLLGLSKGSSTDWDRRIIVELDSAMDKWMDELPDHLRWNPTQEHPEFFEQSVALHCSYYHLQIIIHRAYIPSPKKMGHLTLQAFPSMAVCLNAARSCIHVIDIHRQRTGDKPLPLSQTAVFSAGLVLLLNIWGGKRSGLGLSTDFSQDMAEVHRCMQILRGCEMRWQSAGKLWDILSELASVGQLPLPANGSTKNKRERGAEEPKSTTHPDRGKESMSPSSGSGSSGRSPPVQERHLRPLPSNVPNVMADPVSGGNPIMAGQSRPIAGGRRLHTSDVPPITTQFLPHLQHRQGYASDTPHSVSSLRSQQQDRFMMPIHGDESQRRRLYAGPDTLQHPEGFIPLMQREETRPLGLGRPHGPPDTPLLPSSAHSHRRDSFLSHRNEESQSHTHAHSPVTPLSAPVHRHHQPIPFAPSMNSGLAELHDQIHYHSRGMLDDDRARGVGPGQDYTNWYSQSDRARPIQIGHSRPRSPLQSQSSSSNPDLRLPIPHGSTSLSFPMSEAFYEQLTASFSSVPNQGHNHRHPTPVDYSSHLHHEYPDGGARHRVLSNASAHSSHGLVPGHGAPPGTERHPRGAPAHGILDPDPMTLWQATPSEFEMDDWGSYLDTVNEITQARMHPSGTLPSI
ncbi:fungal-specific transcription factor domain-containing protein [Mycena epipterygia]|nr:fungal-specific transcription factor domain-containing protein [Mycena epipterygia]